MKNLTNLLEIQNEILNTLSFIENYNKRKMYSMPSNFINYCFNFENHQYTITYTKKSNILKFNIFVDGKKSNVNKLYNIWNDKLVDDNYITRIERKTKLEELFAE